MKKIELIKNNFAYLHDLGFEFTVDFGHPGYKCCFVNDENIKIIISESEDYRDENHIAFVVKKGVKTLLSFYDAPMINAELIGVDEMVSSVNSVYQSAKKKFRGFSKVQFEQIIKLYSEFIAKNLVNITGRTIP